MKLISSFACALVIVALCSALRTKVQKLNNGILLQESGTIRVKVANYQVFITQNKPTRNHWLSASANIVAALKRNARMINTPPAEWLRRHALVTRLLTNDQSRSKRGLINFIGKASRYLFGTATTDDVNKIKRNLEEITDRESEVRHQVNQLTSYVNTNIRNERILVAKFRAFRNYLSDLQHHFDAIIIPQFQNISNRLALIDAQTNVNAVLASFEAFTLLQLQQEDAFEQAQFFVSLGRLNPATWPPVMFTDIQKSQLPHAMQFLDPGWYYQHTQIVPLTSDPEQIIWTANMPLVSNAIYRQFSITTAPVPLGKKSVQLVLPSVLGLNTDHQTVIQPTLCIGNTVQVCDNNFHRINTQHSCFYAIIANLTDQLNECSIKVYGENTPQIQQIADNAFILQTNGERLHEKCVGHYEIVSDIEQGTYLISPEQSCTLITSLGELTAIVQLQTTKVFNTSEIASFDFKLADFVDPIKISGLPAFHNAEVPDDDVLYLQLLPTLPPVTWFNWEVPHAPAITAGGVIALIISVILVTLCCMNAKVRKACITRCLKCAKATKAKVVTVILPTTSSKGASEDVAIYANPSKVTKLDSKEESIEMKPMDQSLYPKISFT